MLRAWGLHPNLDFCKTSDICWKVCPDRISRSCQRWSQDCTSIWKRGVTAFTSVGLLIARNPFWPEKENGIPNERPPAGTNISALVELLRRTGAMFQFIVLGMLFGLPVFPADSANPVAPVTLYTNYEEEIPDSVQHAMQREVGAIISPAGLTVEWRSLSALYRKVNI